MFVLLAHHIRRLRADRRAASAMEFAMISPLLFTMLLGIIEYGFVFYGYSSMQKAANQVARGIAVNAVPVGEAQSRFESLLPGWIDNVSVTTAQTDPGDPTRSYVAMRVQSPASALTPIAIFTRTIPMTLTADASVKQELPYEN